MQTTFFNWKNNNLILHVIIQPNASEDRFMGLMGNRLKIRLKAPPTDGKANKYLVKYLAKVFKLPNNAVSVVKGKTSRQKTLIIESLKETPSQLLKFTTEK